MGEYQKIRSEHSFLEMCKTPKISAEITLQPVRAFGFDAAILFSDILIPVEAMGVDIEFVEGRGPVLKTKIEEKEDVEKLIVPNPDVQLTFVLEAMKILRKRLEVPLIGFSGAPFTSASYMIEGGGSKNYLKTKSIMYNEPSLWKMLMTKLVKTLSAYLNAQIDAGAEAVQIFDSWVGCLSPNDYKKYVQPYTKSVIDDIKGDIPVINFGTGTSGFLELLKDSGGDVIGVDWRINLDAAWKRIGYDRGIQGNLDPLTLYGPPDEIVKKTQDILKMAEGHPGHVFNLGHGIQPTTPIESVKTLVDAVKKFSTR
jgi:uroporphyrinogen decarboxylase